jgi:hypothetical protein
MDTAQKTAIERFVRGTLGCQCPDEVFRRVEVSPLALPNGGGSDRKLVIGGRLLIHIVAPPGRADEPGWIERVAQAGRDERDRLAYNRYRLVVASTAEAADRTSLEQRFAGALAGDERANLHVLAADLLPIV